MSGHKALFTEYASKIPSDAPARQAPPAANIPVLIRSVSISKHEVEAMLVKAHGRSGLRWQLFGMPGYPNRVSYPHRGWQPDSWRYKHTDREP